MNKISNIIPVFPLRGAILLPHGNLPLNIFEPRYLSMIDYSLGKDKLIGIIQPKNKDEKELYKIGCVGKISSFNETDDNRYLINLAGISKFNIREEEECKKPFRVFRVDYEPYINEFDNFNNNTFNKKILLGKIKSYFKNKGIDVNLEAANNIDDKSFIIMIAMICPFNHNEKQMLLESKNIDDLVVSLETLIDFSLNKHFQNDSIN